MNITRYVGITLLFIYRNKEGCNAVLQSFISNAVNLNELEKEVSRIGLKVSKGVKDGQCKYMGIHDAFEVHGPFKQGAILGRSTLWSYKTIDSAKKLLNPQSEFWINAGGKFTKKLIAEVVFLLSSPVKYSDRRVLICNVLIGASNKSEVFQKASKIGATQQLKEKLFKILLRNEPALVNGFQFIGIANIKPVYDKVGVGKCFEAVYKKEHGSSSVKRLVFPISKFSYLYKEAK